MAEFYSFVAGSSYSELLKGINEMSEALNTRIDALRTQVAAVQTVSDSVLLFTQSVPGLIRDAVEAARAEGASDAQLAALDELSARLGGEAQEMTAAILAVSQPTPDPLPSVVEPPPPGVEPAPAVVSATATPPEPATTTVGSPGSVQQS